MISSCCDTVKSKYDVPTINHEAKVTAGLSSITNLWSIIEYPQSICRLYANDLCFSDVLVLVLSLSAHRTGVRTPKFAAVVTILNCVLPSITLKMKFNRTKGKSYVELDMEMPEQHSYTVNKYHNRCWGGRFWCIKDICGMFCALFTWMLILYAE